MQDLYHQQYFPVCAVPCNTKALAYGALVYSSAQRQEGKSRQSTPKP